MLKHVHSSTTTLSPFRCIKPQANDALSLNSSVSFGSGGAEQLSSRSSSTSSLHEALPPRKPGAELRQTAGVALAKEASPFGWPLQTTTARMAATQQVPTLGRSDNGAGSPPALECGGEGADPCVEKEPTAASKRARVPAAAYLKSTARHSGKDPGSSPRPSQPRDLQRFESSAPTRVPCRHYRYLAIRSKTRFARFGERRSARVSDGFETTQAEASSSLCPNRGVVAIVGAGFRPLLVASPGAPRRRRVGFHADQGDGGPFRGNDVLGKRVLG
ncbi:hypothetical protein HPB52_007295 [Rhipicephalus sanguineus]|uniref:Uncharacterized protein n=1 Tax=Rhipicephalus sanguineus TaxID=34632 RepID=A0A9D4QLQ2_RHISA|nr:hypothetical protein HPB52_007295 [Rhipicephalus sanguineus]